MPGSSHQIPDPLGLRRNPSSGGAKAVPLLFSNPPSAERKKPWWIEDRHDVPNKSREELEREARERDHLRSADPAMRDREGVSHLRGVEKMIRVPVREACSRRQVPP